MDTAIFQRSAEQWAAILGSYGSKPIPPVDQWQPKHFGEIDLTIRRDGSWWHEGTRFERPALITLLSRVLWYEGGEYFLKTPAECLKITVEDLPFLFHQLAVKYEGPEQELLFTSLGGEVVLADIDHPILVTETTTGEPQPSIDVRFGMKGRLSRGVFYQLGEMAVQRPASSDADITEYVIRSAGCDFILGKSV